MLFWFNKNCTQNGSADIFLVVHVLILLFSGKFGEIWESLGKMWPKMVLEVPWFEKNTIVLFWRSISAEFLSGRFGGIWAKTLRTPKSLPAPTPMIKSHWKVQFVNFMDCKKIISGAFRNHTIFAKPICKGSGCRWCTYHRTLRKDYNMCLQPPPFTKLFPNAKRNNWLLLSGRFSKPKFNKSPFSRVV